MKILWNLVLACCAAVPAVGAQADGEMELRFALVMSRHGICGPGSNAEYEHYARDAWPKWVDPVGRLTERGERQMTTLGEYYRARFVDSGLLTGAVEHDKTRIYFRANSDQRTLGSARRLGAGLLPGVDITVNALPEGRTDPLFRPNLIPVGTVDRALADAAVLGRMSNDPNAVVQAHEATFAALQRVMYGDDGIVPAGKEAFVGGKASLGPSLGSHIVSLTGGLRVGMVFPDTFMMEYAQGLPVVGWGRVTRRSLTQLLALHSLYYDLTQRALYPAQVQGSNIAHHILLTLEQAGSGVAVPGAIGDPSSRLVVVVGHDTNLLNLSGLMNVTWLLPDTQPNLVAPGGALVFELWRRRGDGQQFVRVSYVGESLDQMRELQSLSLANPPPIAPLFIPGCSTAKPGYDAPLAEFADLLRRVIDPQFVSP